MIPVGLVVPILRHTPTHARFQGPRITPHHGHAMATKPADAAVGRETREGWPTARGAGAARRGVCKKNVAQPAGKEGREGAAVWTNSL